MALNDEMVSDRLKECFTVAETLLKERDKELGCDSHFTYENTQVAIALFNADYGNPWKKSVMME